MATILKLKNGKYKAILRNPKGRYLRSKTFTRPSVARPCLYSRYRHYDTDMVFQSILVHSRNYAINQIQR